MTCCRPSTTFSVAVSCIVTSSRTTLGSPSVAARARSGSSCYLTSRSPPSRWTPSTSAPGRTWIHSLAAAIGAPGIRQPNDMRLAVTLYEMATARRPEYGAGAHPGFTDADATIEPELFDRSYAPGLAEFFRIALNRDAVQRYDTAEAMRRAWDAVFAQPTTLAAEPVVARITRDTPVGAAPLSPQVLAVLERLGAATVGAATDLSPAQVTWLPGIGTATRLKLREELDKLARQVSESTKEQPTEPTLLDRVAADLVPETVDRNLAETLLGLGESNGGAWTSLRDAAKALGREQRAVRESMSKLERHWVGLDGMRELRDTITEVVESVGGVASARHCATALLDFKGSTVEEPLRSRLAEAVLRAAVDAELADPDLDGDPRLVYSRERHGILIAAGPSHADQGPSTADRLEWAVRLGRAADELAGADPLPVPASVIDSLRAVQPPGDDRSLSSVPGAPCRRCGHRIADRRCDVPVGDLPARLGLGSCTPVGCRNALWRHRHHARRRG